MSNTTLMNPTDELFTDLAPAQAEVVGGGYGLIVYNTTNGRGWLGSFNYGKNVLSPKANNKIGSVRVNYGDWKLSDWFYGLGPNRKLYDNGFVNLAKLGFNNRTSSISRIG